MQAVSIHAPLTVILSAHPAGSVCSVHRRAVNLVFGADLVTAVAPEWGNGPGNLVCSNEVPFTALGWAPGDPVRVAGGCICGPGGHRLVWGAAACWEPPPPPAAVAGQTILRENRERLAGALVRHGHRGGLLPAALAMAGRQLPLTPLARFALPRLHALLAGDPGAAGGLAGLGPGLTPSGDDLLAGYAVTLHRAGRPTGLLEGLSPTVTTPISWHLLRWARQGVAGEHALALVDQLLTRSGPAAVAALAPVLAHGATSGSDWAAGALLALVRLSGEPRRGGL